jgi:hypothetical protein
MQDFPLRIRPRSEMQKMPERAEAPTTENESDSDNADSSDKQPIRRSGSSQPAVCRSDSSSCDWSVRKLQNQIEQEIKIKQSQDLIKNNLI